MKYKEIKEIVGVINDIQRGRDQISNSNILSIQYDNLSEISFSINSEFNEPKSILILQFIKDLLDIYDADIITLEKELKKELKKL